MNYKISEVMWDDFLPLFIFGNRRTDRSWCIFHISIIIPSFDPPIDYIIKRDNMTILLNRVLGTQYRIEYLKVIRAKQQSMTEKFHTVRQLNCPRQLIMYLINLSSYFK